MTEQVENKPRRFVWTSKGAPRESQTLSIWALVETLVATVFVNALAWYFDYYIWLLSSVLIGPLLLLRSPKSMATAVRWHEKDFFGLRNDEQWSIPRLVTFMVIVALITGLIIILPLIYLAEFMLTGQSGWGLVLSLIGYVMIVGVLDVSVSVTVIATVTGVIVGAVAGAGGAVGVVVAGAVAVGVAGAGVVAVVVAGAVAVAVAVVVFVFVVGVLFRILLRDVAVAWLGAVVGVGVLFRTLLMRLSATCWHCILGFKQLPRNWWENCFVVDCTVAPTLMPVDRHCSKMIMPNTWEEIKIALSDYPLVKMVIGFIWFFPGYLYRLNIKSTFWFYWPLVFLLAPVKQKDDKGAKHMLQYAFNNPVALFFHILAFLWFITFIVHNNGFVSLWTGVPIWLQYLLITDWSEFEVWHILSLTIGVLSFCILILSGHARSLYTGNIMFHKSQKWAVPLMTSLIRLRRLAVIFSFVLAIGAVMIQLDWLSAIVSMSPEWLAPRLQESFAALRHFYHIQPLPIP